MFNDLREYIMVRTTYNSIMNNVLKDRTLLDAIEEINVFLKMIDVDLKLRNEKELIDFFLELIHEYSTYGESTVESSFLRYEDLEEDVVDKLIEEVGKLELILTKQLSDFEKKTGLEVTFGWDENSEGPLFQINIADVLQLTNKIKSFRDIGGEFWPELK